MNFSFLSQQTEYALFAPACVEAEKIYASAPAMCAVGCRKALELAIKWVYAADKTMKMPYKDNLQSLIHEPSFRFAVDSNTWGKLPFIIKLGNLAVHTERSVQSSDALASLKGLFEFVQWLDYCYGSDYQERVFDESLIPTEKVAVDTRKIKEQESLLDEKEAEIEALRKQIEQMSAQYTAEKEKHQQERSFQAEDLSEFQTRKIYIDVDLKFMGWKFDGTDADVQEEYPVQGMAGVVGQMGYCDYVLFGKDGLPLAVIEAKRTSKDPNIGRKQAVLYADCLERKFGRRPMMFTTNGFETYYWDDQSGPQRKVSGVFSKEDLQKLMNRRTERQDLMSIPIDDKITDRYYQKEAIRAVCGQIEQGFRKHLLVMATGTGKTRTASSLTDVLSRGKWVTNILFLADRTALVKQAKDDFKRYLPDMSLCNLCSNKDDRNARIVFSTYPTILNAIDDTKSKDGRQLFTPAHFDLIIIDESHRSIFKKYRAIFEYFDALMVGLTATPKTDVDRNTYDFFEMEHGVPTYAYDYETAVYQDHVLVPYYNYEVKTKFLDEGITYDDLSDEDKERYEDDFIEDGMMPDFIPSAALNKFVFNEKTVDMVLQDLMERGIKVAGGDRLGKTIIFAQNKRHAEFILERFNKLYPQYHGSFAQRVICDDSYAQTIIDDFKQPEKEPHIAVSVDMMDTGIDVPECVNLVFFKKVRSKAKFWQMIGRGTRLCPGLINGEDKKMFYIFDFCGNFEFFRMGGKGRSANQIALQGAIFNLKAQMAFKLQDFAYQTEELIAFRKELVDDMVRKVKKLNKENFAVRQHLKYVELYANADNYTALSYEDTLIIADELAPLITPDEDDPKAMRFDALMYGIELAYLAGKKYNKARSDLYKKVSGIAGVANIPEIMVQSELIDKILHTDYVDTAGINEFEHIRKSLRDLIKYIPTGGAIYHTNFDDEILSIDWNESELENDDLKNYKAKAEFYVRQHQDNEVIAKLKSNIPLSAADVKVLEEILWSEVGTKEDYEAEFGEKPLGEFVREIVGLDMSAAKEAFAQYLNDVNLDSRQIYFVNQIVEYIVHNGLMKDLSVLQESPFTDKGSVVEVFTDLTVWMGIRKVIEQVNANAIAA